MAWCLVLPSLLLLPLPLVSQRSPWWEQYEHRDTYLCSRLGKVVVERNEAQASLIRSGIRSTTFRYQSPLSGVRYRNDRITLVLRGDILTIEQLPARIDCTRMEQV